MFTWLIVIFWAISCPAADSAKILAYFMTPSYSHQVVYQPIWRELSLRGHQVTVATTNPLNDPTLVNLTEIDLGFSYELWGKLGIATLGTQEHSSTEEIKRISEAYAAVTEAQLTHPKIQEIIKNLDNTTYDLFIVEMIYPIMYGFKDIYKCPMVGISSLPLLAGANEAIGQPTNPALEPEITLPFSTNLTFKERLISTSYRLIYKVLINLVVKPKLESMKEKYFGKIRPLYDMAQEVSLVIQNSHLAITNVKPQIPGIIDIAGIHINEKKPLPEDLQKFLDASTEGVIYFSLGSNVKSKYLPEKQSKMFMEVFQELPYKILWKFEDDHFPGKPKNVEIRKWLPQQDLLGHPNVKLFITQGGIQSVDEAIHNAVPCLTIPFFGDQRYNSHHLREYGGSLSINFHEFTKEEFKEKILEIITNPSYKDRMITLSKIAKDQPMSAVDKSVWWIEYILRHQGAPHLRYPGVDMPYYQYFLIDVLAFMAAVVLLILYILVKIWRLACKLSQKLRTIRQVREHAD